MNATWLSYTAFAVVCVLLLTLPFVPAFREWLNPTDYAALPVSANYTADIDHFARRLHADVSARLGEGKPTGYENFDMLAGSPEGVDWQGTTRRLIATQSLRTDNGINSKRQLYVEGHLKTGERSLFPSVYATGDLTLGAYSEVHDWAHAGGTLSIGHHGVAMRRVSSGERVGLGEEVWFERVHAPSVTFGDERVEPGVDTAPRAPGAAARYDDIAGAVRRTPSLYFVQGDCSLPPGGVYDGGLVVTGFLTIGAGTTVRGDVKARDGLTLGVGATVLGAITCEHRVHLAEGAAADGPVVSESDILLDAGSVVGLSDGLTTVTARNIIARPGARVHGTVWAHEVGLVTSA